jgi:uncharacterized protein YqhQ
MKYVVALAVLVIAVLLFSAVIHVLLTVIVPVVALVVVAVIAYKIGKTEGRHEERSAKTNQGLGHRT